MYESTITQLMLAMIEYDAPDAKRIQHFIKVHNFAATIGKNEKLPDETLFILESAAILHDIGIHPAEAKYGNSNGKHQEELGPQEAKVLLQKLSYNQNQIDRICYLIGHHHTYTDIDGIDYQILVEADFLVNILEDNLSTKTAISVKQNIFKTNTGLLLLHNMYGI